MVRLSIQNLNKAFYLRGLFSIPDAVPQTTVPGLHKILIVFWFMICCKVLKPIPID